MEKETRKSNRESLMRLVVIAIFVSGLIISLAILIPGLKKSKEDKIDINGTEWRLYWTTDYYGLLTIDKDGYFKYESKSDNDAGGINYGGRQSSYEGFIDGDKIIITKSGLSRTNGYGNILFAGDKSLIIENGDLQGTYVKEK